MTDNLIFSIIAIAFAIGLFFVLRFAMLWYWRIDTIVTNQEETNRLLKRLLDKAEESKAS